MERIFVIAGFILAVLAGYVYNSYSGKKKLHRMLVEKFGMKPEDREYDFNEIRILWDETRMEDDRIIDDTTWNDLSMDKVFARINTCCSAIGEQYLYRSLRTVNFDAARLDVLEEKIIYMYENQDDRTDIQKKLLQTGKRTNSYYVPSFLNALENFKLNKIWIYYLLQMLLFLAIIVSIFLHHTFAYAFLGISFLVNINVYALMKNKYEINMDLIMAVQGMLRISKELAEKKETAVSGVFRENIETVNKLARSMTFVSGRYQRKNSVDFMELCATYLTGAFLFDFVLYNRILAKLEDHLTVVYKIYDSLGELDMAVSTASFRRSIPVYCVPEFCKEYRIDYKEVYNPLLESPVYNDFSLSGHCIITGSNASGKSTFIKAIAVNEILAMSIHTCAAGTARIAKAEIYTSMAIQDDLLAGESYFVREVKSLQRIVKAVDQGRFVIAVIDEILRGTNTGERIAASAAILKYLESKNCIVVVASHDMELVEMLNDGYYVNYYFCEKAKKEEIVFDYKIHGGICKMKNAIKLLDYFGFPERIIADANGYLAKANCKCAQKGAMFN